MTPVRRGYHPPMTAARRAFALTFWTALSLALLGGSARSDRDPADQLHRFTAPVEFDFVGWTLGALGAKLGQDSIGEVGYLPEAERTEWVRRYLDLVDQAGVVLADGDLASLGAPFPPVAFHMSRLPLGLVVSPRSVIRQDALITLLPDLTLEEQVALERAVESQLGLSALVVQIGGIGTYPTMVEETTAVDWLAGGVGHEWTHNHLTLRPLGLAYDASPETRTMNETTANLIGKAFGRALIERYYPERLPPPAPAEAQAPSAQTESPP